MLRDDLKKVQNQRNFIFKILIHYLDKMGNKELMTLNDYLAMTQLKKEIKDLNKHGLSLVKQIHEGGC